MAEGAHHGCRDQGPLCLGATVGYCWLVKSAERFDFSCMVTKRKMPRTDVWEMCSRCIRSGGVGPSLWRGLA